MKVLIGFTDNFRCSRNRTSSDKDYVASLLLLSKILQKHKFHQIKISDKNSSEKIIRRHKSVEILAWCRKFCPSKSLIRRKFCPTNFCSVRHPQSSLRKKRRRFFLVSNLFVNNKILSIEMFLQRVSTSLNKNLDKSV